MTPWTRLQCLSCEHNMRLYRAGTIQSRAYGRAIKPGVNVTEEIKENVDILGRGNDEEIKSRVFWYITFMPDVFQTCSSRGWRLP